MYENDRCHHRCLCARGLRQGRYRTARNDARRSGHRSRQVITGRYQRLLHRRGHLLVLERAVNLRRDTHTHRQVRQGDLAPREVCRHRTHQVPLTPQPDEAALPRAAFTFLPTESLATYLKRERPSAGYYHSLSVVGRNVLKQ